MATSSITKDFLVKDKKAYDLLLHEVKAAPERKVKLTEASCLNKGREQLAKFSFR